MKSLILVFFFLTSAGVVATCALESIQGTEARTEEVLDSGNYNLKISMQTPENWNSGKLSMTVLALDWKLNGLFATNFATKLLGSGDESVAFFAVINAPSLANAAMPVAQKLGLISILLSQYATIDGENDLRLSDGSFARVYSITLDYDQLQKLSVPIDRPIQATLIISQQHGNTYLIVYGTEQGRMTEYQDAFSGILSSVNIGSASFSTRNQTLFSLNMTNATMGGDTGSYRGVTSGNLTMIEPSEMRASSPGSEISISIVPGSSSQANGKFFMPQNLTSVSKGTKVIWTNDDTATHTVTSGSVYWEYSDGQFYPPEDPRAKAGGMAGFLQPSRLEFDSGNLSTGMTFEHLSDKVGQYDYYCTLHPFMHGWVLVS